MPWLADGFGAFQPAFGGADLGAAALHGQALQPFAVLDAQLQAGGAAEGDAGVVEVFTGGDGVHQVHHGVRQRSDVEGFGGCR